MENKHNRFGEKWDWLFKCVNKSQLKTIQYSFSLLSFVLVRACVYTI